MDYKGLLEKTWSIFTEFLPAMLLITLGLIGISIVTLGILAPVATAGYTQSLLLAVRDNRKPEIGDLFSQMRLFLPLLGFGVLVFIALMLGFAMLVLPGIIMVLALAFFCLYLLPLMTDREMGLIDAVKESSRLAMEDPIAEHFVVVALFIGIIAIGQSFVIGSLFTQPFATLFILLVYELKTGKEPPKPATAPATPSPPPPPPEQE
ncbi:MAG TPA: hypothetical protein DDY20_09775 [Desulfobulbaceae bacterium]|nr:hypothetical protein [Desulfobulbaceae bacterium]